MPRPPITKTGAKAVPKTFVFDPDEWAAFEEKTKQLGMSPSSFFRKVVNDYVQGRYFHIDTAPANLLPELQKRREELRLTTLQPVLDILFAEWLDRRANHKGK